MWCQESCKGLIPVRKHLRSEGKQENGNRVRIKSESGADRAKKTVTEIKKCATSQFISIGLLSEKQRKEENGVSSTDSVD